MTEEFLKLVDADIKDIAIMVFDQVLTEITKDNWQHAILYSAGSFSKLRIKMADGTVNAGITPPTSEEFLDALDRIGAARDQSAEKWQGMKITVFPDGKCDVEFAYDNTDPSFFDS